MYRRKLLKATASAAVMPTTPVFAQGGVRKILVGFAPGTATDVVARVLGQAMSTGLGRSFVVG